MDRANPFRAFRIFEENGKSAGRFVKMNLNDLDPGEVVIQAHYSSVNCKDALAATGAGKVIRRFPCVDGVDAAGVVESSSDMRFKPGDAVIVTGYGMGGVLAPLLQKKPGTWGDRALCFRANGLQISLGRINSLLDSGLVG